MAGKSSQSPHAVGVFMGVTGLTLLGQIAEVPRNLAHASHSTEAYASEVVSTFWTCAFFAMLLLAQGFALRQAIVARREQVVRDAEDRERKRSVHEERTARRAEREAQLMAREEAAERDQILIGRTQPRHPRPSKNPNYRGHGVVVPFPAANNYANGIEEWGEEA